MIYWYDQTRFIGRFQKLITCQIENKCYSDALKAFKRFKIHGLNSTNPKNITPHFHKILSQSKEIKRCSSELDEKKLGGIYSELTIITELCQLKCKIFEALNDDENYALWTHYTLSLWHEPRIGKSIS